VVRVGGLRFAARDRVSLDMRYESLRPAYAWVWSATTFLADYNL